MKKLFRKANPNKSISGQVNRFSLWLTAALALPAIISLIMMLTSSHLYQRSLQQMEKIAQLRPIVTETVPEGVWDAVAGRTAFEESGVWNMISSVNSALEDMENGVNEQERLELTIARRTMDTLSGYVSEIESNIALKKPVVESEKTLEVVREVAALVDSMLQNYINEEINRASNVNSMLHRLTLGMAGIEIILILAALVLAQRAKRKLSGTISYPLSRMEHFAGLVAGGDLAARLPDANVEELVPLTEQINSMADHLESLFAQNKLEQENLRKSELRTLQAQINPHFLYNTLDAIVWQAEAGKTDEVIRTTRALSDFFRISLSSGADWIPIRQEQQHLNGYLSIQQTRYRDILRYEVDIDESLSEVYILKLLLQPLVENALYHGIKYKRGGGTIYVRGRREGDLLYFSVTDTGRGMSPEQLDEVTKRMRGELPPDAAPYAGNGSGFGLRNVDRRIRLYYESQEGLHIESGSGGTTVSFRVPPRGKEEFTG